MEKVKFLEGKGAHPFLLCSSDIASVAKLSIPQFSHIWKIHQSLQDFKDHHRKAVAVCKAWIKSIRIYVKNAYFF